MALIDNDTQDDIMGLVIFGFTLAIIVGILGYVIGTFRRGQ
jgi:predicted MFS family arabinose efflux permease